MSFKSTANSTYSLFELSKESFFMSASTIVGFILSPPVQLVYILGTSSLHKKLVKMVRNLKLNQCFRHIHQLVEPLSLQLLPPLIPYLPTTVDNDKVHGQCCLTSHTRHLFFLFL